MTQVCLCGVQAFGYINTLSCGHAITSWGQDQALKAFHLSHTAGSAPLAIWCGTIAGCGGGIVANALSCSGKTPEWIFGTPVVLKVPWHFPPNAQPDPFPRRHLCIPLSLSRPPSQPPLLFSALDRLAINPITGQRLRACCRAPASQSRRPSSHPACTTSSVTRMTGRSLRTCHVALHGWRLRGLGVGCAALRRLLCFG